MKRVLLLAMAFLVLISALWVSTGKAGAAGLITYAGGRFVWGKGVVFVFDASGNRNKDVKEANIFAGSNFHDLYCTVDKEKQNIVCVARGSLTEYAGQTGIIYLAGQIFYVTIPDRTLSQVTAVEGPLVCEAPDVLGASVRFQTSQGFSFTDFVPGDTLQEVQARADGWVDGEFIIAHGPIGDLECGMPPQ